MSARPLSPHKRKIQTKNQRNQNRNTENTHVVELAHLNDKLPSETGNEGRTCGVVVIGASEVASVLLVVVSSKMVVVPLKRVVVELDVEVVVASAEEEAELWENV